MNAINGAGQNVLALDTQGQKAAGGAEFQPSDPTSDTPSIASTTGDGACPRQHAPPSSPVGPFSDANAFPRGRWTAALSIVGLSSSPPPKLVEAPLHELFWSPPETSMAEDATQRIAALLHSAANAVQEIQLFDDLYEVPVY